MTGLWRRSNCTQTLNQPAMTRQKIACSSPIISCKQSSLQAHLLRPQKEPTVTAPSTCRRLHRQRALLLQKRLLRRIVQLRSLQVLSHHTLSCCLASLASSCNALCYRPLACVSMMSASSHPAFDEWNHNQLFSSTLWYNLGDNGQGRVQEGSSRPRQLQRWSGRPGWRGWWISSGGAWSSSRTRTSSWRTCCATQTPPSAVHALSLTSPASGWLPHGLSLSSRGQRLSSSKLWCTRMAIAATLPRDA